AIGPITRVDGADFVYSIGEDDTTRNLTSLDLRNVIADPTLQGDYDARVGPTTAEPKNSEAMAADDFLSTALLSDGAVPVNPSGTPFPVNLAQAARNYWTPLPSIEPSPGAPYSLYGDYRARHAEVMTGTEFAHSGLDGYAIRSILYFKFAYLEGSSCQ
ncbi:MAG: hypothetical protein ABR548_06785, partial [Actinomycetota bacterium]